MPSALVLVNGAPGSGKTTLCKSLGPELGAPVVSKDAIKEALADSLPGCPLATQPLGAIASETMWSLASLVSGLAIIESFWCTGRDDAFLRSGLERLGNPPGVELWCEAPFATTRERFTTRARHHAHDDAHRVDEWERNFAHAVPCSGLPVVRVDTSTPVDCTALASKIRATFAGAPGAESHQPGGGAKPGTVNG